MNAAAPSFKPHAECASCGCAITWEKTINGKSMPVDYEPSADGNLVIRDGVAHVVKVGDQLALGEDSSPERFKSHFATCKFADQHRRAT